jgi:hypothetical protein
MGAVAPRRDGVTAVAVARDDRLGVPARAGRVVADGFGHVDGVATGLAQGPSCVLDPGLGASICAYGQSGNLPSSKGEVVVAERAS